MNLQQLLRQPQIWRGRGHSPFRKSHRLPTGWENLDTHLPQGGWIPGTLTEILVARHGVGELTLIAPALKQLSRDGQRLVCVAPPHHLFPPALQQKGMVLKRFILIDAAPRDALWAAEQCLRSGCCRAVLCWPDPVCDRQLRRLQLAAEKGGAHGFVFRPAAASAAPSPAATRITITAGGEVAVLKARGGFSNCRFPLPN